LKGLVVRKRAVLILSDFFILNPHFAALLSTVLTMPLALPSPFLLSLLTDAAAPGLMPMDLMTVMMDWRGKEVQELHAPRSFKHLLLLFQGFVC
jgi:hypothetical protein